MQMTYVSQKKLQSLSSTTDNIKTVYDQKACKILNKTTTVLDKIKEQSEDIKTLSEKAKQSQTQCVDKLNVPKQQTEQTKTTHTQSRKLHDNRPSQNTKPTKTLASNEPKQKRFKHVAEFSSPAVIGCAQNFIWSVNGNAYLILNIFFAINPIIPVRTVM